MKDQALLESIASEMKARKAAGGEPDLAGYLRRYPHLQESLCALAAEVGVSPPTIAPFDTVSGAPAADVYCTVPPQPSGRDVNATVPPIEASADVYSTVPPVQNPPDAYQTVAPVDTLGDGTVPPTPAAPLAARRPASEAAAADEYATVPPLKHGRAAAQAAPVDVHTTAPPAPTRGGGDDDTAGDVYQTNADAPAFDAQAAMAAAAAALDWPQVPGYEIQGELGRGGMGVVYKARQAGLRRTVALKMILSGKHAGEAELARFRLEGEAVARLQHPNIVQIYEVGEHEGRPFFSLEYLDGGSLAGQLRGVLQSPRQAAELSVKLADAMQAAHDRGIVHRDLKPANILLTATGEPKITDFGLAKNLEDDMSQTRSGQIMGTPTYMAPEQARGDLDKIGPASDVYSLGAILYEQLTGRTPFVGATLVELLDQVRNDEPPRLRKFQPKLPIDLETICLKCLEKQPEKRYTTAAGFANDLRRFLANEPVQARRTPLWERGVKYVKRRPALSAFYGVLALALLGGASWTVSAGVRQAHQSRLRNEVQDLLYRIQTDVGEQEKKRWSDAQWDDSERKLEGVQAMIHSEPALADLEQRAQDLQARVARGQEDKKSHQGKLDSAQKKNSDFRAGLNTAMINQMTSVGVKQQEHMLKIREAAPKALALYGVTLDNDQLPDASSPYLDERQKANILPDSYELLLAWAHAASYPLKLKEEEPIGQAKLALAILDRAAKLGLDTKAYHMRRGSYLLVLGDQAAAKAELNISQKMQPATASDYFLVGNEMYQAGPTLKEPFRTQVMRQAIENLQKALDLQPEHYWSNYTLGQIYLQSARWDAAVARFTACIQKQPEILYAYPLRAHAHSMLNEYELAEADFALGEKVNDDEIVYSVFVNRGFMHFRLAQALGRNQQNSPKASEALDKAITQYRRAIALEPNYYQAYLNLSQVYQQQGKLDDALVMLNKAVEVQPGMAALERTRARLHLRRKDYKAALADFELAVKHNTVASPALADDHLERGRILYRLRRFPEALAAFEQAETAHPDEFPRAQRLRAETLLELGRFKESLAALERYLNGGGPPIGDVFLARGLVHAKMGNYRAAIEDYTVALRADRSRDDDDDPEEERLKQVTALTYRGWAHMICEAPLLAEKDFSEALKLDGKNSDALSGRGNARVLQGDDRGGIADADEAAKLGPPSARLLYNCSRIYARAIDKLDREAGFNGADALQRRRQYVQRAMGLLRDALDQLPPGERANFWRTVIVPDPALKALQRSNDFQQLGQRVVSAGT